MKAIIRKHPETNAVVTVNTFVNKDGQTEEYGKLRVEQIALQSNNGVLDFKSRSAFISVFGAKNLALAKAMFQDGMEYPSAGKIVRTESRTPLYEGQSPKINPSTGEIHLVDGAPVYFTDEWSDNANAQDTLISASAPVAVASEEEGA